MTNFLNTSKSLSEDAQQSSRFEEAVVVSTGETDDTLSDHSVKVATRSSGQIEAEVLLGALGDFYLPPSGQIVTIGYLKDGNAVVVGTNWIETDREELEAGERRISHPISEANVEFDSDGDVTVENDSGTSMALTDDKIVFE